jgi:hypothetical protein
MSSRTRLCVLILLCSGCGHGPAAVPILDPESATFPLRPIHFVEHGMRGRGRFVDATPGFENAFRANWSTVLVPLAPSPLAGPAWTGRSVGGAKAVAIATLPAYRSVNSLTGHGDFARRRFRQNFVWVLGTDPLILGLPSDEPDPNWQQIATPFNPWPTHFVTDKDLSQSIDGLVVYPDDFRAADALPDIKTQVAVVALEKPLRLDEALDAIAAGNPSRLGTAKTVPLYDPALDPDVQRGAGVARDHPVGE